MLSRKCSSGKPSHDIGAFFNTIGQKRNFGPSLRRTRSTLNADILTVS